MPASAITRAMTIAYGGVTVGTGTSYHLTGIHRWEQDYETLSIEFDVLVQNTTLATFLSDCATLEAAFRTKNSDLTIALNGSNHTAVTHSGDSGFNGRASIVKVGQLGDSNASRIYTCSVTVQLPADEAGKSARRDSSYRLTYDEAGIGTLEVSAVYTATGGTAALTQAQATFPTYAASLQPSGDWDESTAIAYEVDDEDKLVSCSVTFREIVHNQSVGGANDTSLVGERISVSPQRVSAASDRGRGAKPLVTVRVTFDTAVRVASTTDLQSKWLTLRSYLVTVAQTQSGVTSLSVVDESPNYDPSLNRLSGALTLLGSDGSPLLFSQTISSGSRDLGKNFLPVANGDPFAADIHEGPQVHLLTIQSTIFEIDSLGAGRSSAFAAFDDAVQKAEGQGYERFQEADPSDFRYEHTGLNFSTRIPLRQRQRSIVLRRVNRANTEARVAVFTSQVRSDGVL